MRSRALQERTPEGAVALGPVLLMQAREDRRPCIAASLLEGRAVILGAAQRAGRVADMQACARSGIRVLRRATTGTAAYLDGRAILWQLALPHMAALMPDTSPRTLLNRNIRGFLRGLTRAGAASHYFGREWISVRQRPAALVGFDVEPSGAVLIEVFAGYDQPIALPDVVATCEERAVDRWLGKSPAALGELLPQSSPEELARRVIESVAAAASRSLEIDAVADEQVPLRPPVTRSDDPVPEGFVVAEPVRVPIGWLDAALAPAGWTEPQRAWLGGDVLAPLHVLDGVARAVMAADSRALEALAALPIDGATLADLSRAVAHAAASTSGAAGERPRDRE